MKTSKVFLCTLYIVTLSLKVRKHLYPVHLRHFDVGEDEIVGLSLRHFEALLAVFCYIYFVSFVRQDLLERVTNSSFVVYNQ